jgi:formylglycine-generating enzyme required for sulfatase activity
VTAPILKVFVSSTWLDLQPERAAVEKVIQRLRETKFVGMEYFGSREDTPRDVSLAEVDRSQVYVGFFGGRYGSGITEDEYRRAMELGLPCFIYFKPEKGLRPKQCEKTQAKARQQARLKTELRRDHTITEFTSPDDLAAKLTADLHNWLMAEYLTPRLRRAAEGKGRRTEAESLLAALKDTEGLDPALLKQLAQAGFAIVTGDHNTVVQQRGSGGVAVGKKAVAAGTGGFAAGGDVHGNVTIQNIKHTKPARPHPSSAAPNSTLDAYLETVIRECSPLRLKGIDQRAARPNADPLTLASVYVDLNTDLRLPRKKSLAAHLKSPPREGREALETRAEGGESRLVPALEALACHPCLVLLGAPGSGKSTLVQYLALRLAEGRRGNKKALASLGTTWTHGPLLPIRVTLRQFAASLPPRGEHSRACDLWNFITAELEASSLGKATAEMLQAEARKTGALFLLDGLDETKDPAVRARVAECVAEFAKTVGSRARFLLTSRPYAWEEIQHSQQAETEPAPPPVEKAAFAELLGAFPAAYRLAEFKPEQTNLFIERWYHALEAREWISQADAAAQIPVLQQAVKRDDLRHLGRNPLLLTLMATLHSNRTRLPDDRADLYNEVVELLLQRWNENIGADRGLLEALAVPTLKLPDLRVRIEELALEVHAAHAGKDGVADIAEGRLLTAFRDLLGGSLDKAGLVVDYIEKRAGLLLGQGSLGRERQFTFPHRTFQEFLAGCHLASRRDFEREVVRLAEDNPAHWREVLKFAARRATASRGVPAADGLVGHQDVRLEEAPPTEKDFRKALLAAEQLLEIGLAAVSGNREHDVIRRRIVGWLVAVLAHSALPARDRAEAGNLLAKLGDPRREVVPAKLDHLAQMEFCYVPSGEFLMGDERHRNQQLDYGFWIARHPVTVAQFDLFVKAGGYGQERWWTEAKADKRWRLGKVKDAWDQEREAPVGYEEPFGQPNHPAVGVTWYEAAAFARWLGEQWKAGPPPKGDLVRLPLEAEWEKAARGGMEMLVQPLCRRFVDGLTEPEHPALTPSPDPRREFPWLGQFDANKANGSETNIGASSAVGCFPAGASPCGALDLSGNVWEWCQDDAGGARVLRGGSFTDVPVDLRCSYRLDFVPVNRYCNIGFRVVWVGECAR